jgi:hypothetical protein
MRGCCKISLEAGIHKDQPVWRTIAGNILIAIVLFAILILVCRFFKKDVLSVIAGGAKLEFRTKTGHWSFAAFLRMLILTLHSGTISYLLYMVSPESEKRYLLEHIAHSEPTFIWATVVSLIGDFALLGILKKK